MWTEWKFRRTKWRGSLFLWKGQRPFARAPTERCRAERAARRRALEDPAIESCFGEGRQSEAGWPEGSTSTG